MPAKTTSKSPKTAAKPPAVPEVEVEPRAEVETEPLAEVAADGTADAAGDASSPGPDATSGADAMGDAPPKAAAPKRKKAKADEGETKPKAAKRAKNAFMFYCEGNRQRVKEENDLKSVTDVAKKLGEEWKALDAEQKVPYTDKAAEAKQALLEATSA